MLQETVHYMHYALAAYGWPMYVVHNNTRYLDIYLHNIYTISTQYLHNTYARSMCGALASLAAHSCCCPAPGQRGDTGLITDDNCCSCNLAAMKEVLLTIDLNIGKISTKFR